MCLQMLVPVLSVTLSLISLAAGLIPASGYEGKEVNISCSYSGGYESYEKYLCKNNCKSDNDILVTTKNKRRNRYTISDDQQRRIFTSTISNLMLTDQGTYQCAVSKSGTDMYTEVKLEVEPDFCCDESKTHQTYEDSSVSFSCPYQQKDRNILKYLCRGRQPSVCLQQALVTSNNKQSGRFSLTDEWSKEFSVTINDLTPKDSGRYLCGVQRLNSLDVFTAVDLKVKEWCCVNSAELSGLMGYPVTLHCPYPPQHRDNRKFLCKGDHRKTCTDVMSQSRFSLKENVTSSYFMVTITELRAEDAGTYWCRSDSQWSMGNYKKIQLSVEWCCVKSAELSGLVGHPVTLQCPYPPQHRDNRKFLCKGDHRKTCTDVMSQSRFSLQENVTSSYFMVTIADVRAEDAGTYWCRSNSQWSMGNYTKIQLSVDFPATTGQHPEPTSATDCHDKARFLSLAVIVTRVVSLVLLILTVPVVITCKYKCCRAREAAVGVKKNGNRAAPSQEMISLADAD